MNFTRFPRRMYLQGPTPIEAMPRLSKVLGDKVNLFIKRDDLLPGCAGGNKTRKLEFCIADAIEKGADSLITCGAIQSNHCRLTLAWSKIEQLDCHLILEERVDGSYNEGASGNNFLFKLLGATSSQVVKGGTDMTAIMESKAEDLRSQGKKPYIIPGGASNAIGALGYAACAAEIMNQINTIQLPIHHIVLPSGSAGTHAGMVSGMTGLNVDMPISGINVSRDSETQQAMVYKLAQETVKKLDIKSELKQTSIRCFDEYVGAGYSIPTNGMIEAVQLFARNEAILLDPVYSGKAASGLIDLVKNNYFTTGSNILFLHTGGSPALYAYQNFFK